MAVGQRREREKHDRRAGEQPVPTLVDELDSGGLNRDDDVNLPSPVLHTQEITEGRLIFRVREPSLVDVLGIIGHALFQALLEYSRQLTVTRVGHRRIVTGRVQDEHLFRVGRSPPGPGRTERAKAHGDQQATPDLAVCGRCPRARSHLTESSAGVRVVGGSEVDLGGYFEESRRQDCQRLQPRPVRDEGVVVGQHRTRVQHVVEFKRDQRS